MRVPTASMIIMFFAYANIAQAQDIANPLIKDVTIAVRELCNAPDREGSTWTVSVNGDGGALVKLLHLKLGANFTKTEWRGIQDYLQDRPSLRDCVTKLTPAFLDKFQQVKKDCDSVSASNKAVGISCSDLSGVTIRIQ